MPRASTQTARLYEAEREFGWLGWFISVDDALSYCNTLIATRWWHKRTKVRHVRLEYATVKRWCLTTVEGDSAVMRFARARLCEMYVIHEMVHIPVWGSGDEHEPPFVRMELDMIQYLYNKRRREELERCLLKHKVKW
jgi:hypothetical protein